MGITDKLYFQNEFLRIKLRPQVILMCGLPGSGKSSFAKELLRLIKSRLFLSDEVRKELFSEPNYSQEETEVVYAELLKRAVETLTFGDSVILDATNSSQSRRQSFLKTLSDIGFSTEIVFLRIQNENIAKFRLDSRKGDISDATYEVYVEAKQKFEEPDEAFIIDNDGTLEDLYIRVREFISYLIREG